MDKVRQWSMLTAVGVVAVLALGWFLLVSPQNSHAKSVRAQATTQQAANATLQSQVSQLEQQKAGLPAEQRLLSQLATQIPDNPQLPALIRQLSAAATASGVDLVSLAPSPPAPAVTAATPGAPTAKTAKTATGGHPSPATQAPVGAGNLLQISVMINVTGSYYNIESFFSSIEKLARAMRVTQWNLAAGGASGSGSAAPAPPGSTPSTSAAAPGTLSATMTALVFEAPPVAAAPTTLTAAAK